MKILTIFGFIVVTSFFIGACIAAIDVNEQDLARPCYNARLEELVYFLFNTSPATYLTTDLKEFILKYHLQMDYKLVTSLCMVSSSHFRVPFFETFLSDPHDLELWIALPDLNPFEKLTFTVLHGVPTGGTNTELIFLLLCRSILPELPQESLRDIYFFLVFATCRSGRSFLRIFIDVLKFDVSIWHWMTYIPDDIYDCILRKFNAVEFRGIFYKCSEVKNSIVPFIKHCLSLNLLDSSCVFEDFSLIPTYDIGSDIGLAHTLDKLVAEENYFEIERIFRTHPDISCDPLENYFWSSELLSLLAGISKSPHDLYWWNHFIDRDTTVPTLIYDLILRRTFGKKLTASLKKYQVMGQIGVLLAYLSVDQMENVRVILEEDNILKDYWKHMRICYQKSQKKLLLI